jgi:hypothetical protein
MSSSSLLRKSHIAGAAAPLGKNGGSFNKAAANYSVLLGEVLLGEELFGGFGVTGRCSVVR